MFDIKNEPKVAYPKKIMFPNAVENNGSSNSTTAYNVRHSK